MRSFIVAPRWISLLKFISSLLSLGNFLAHIHMRTFMQGAKSGTRKYEICCSGNDIIYIHMTANAMIGRQRKLHTADQPPGATYVTCFLRMLFAEEAEFTR